MIKSDTSSSISNAPHVVIYTCAYNAEKTIGATIESVINQTYGDFVYYIIENASTDDTEKIINDYCERDKRLYKIKMLDNRLENCGIHFLAMNHALKYAVKWATVIDADDEWDLTYLEKMVSYGDNNDLDYVACGYDKINKDTREVLKSRVLENDFVISRNEGDSSEYTERFIEYRGYTLFWWGKLYNISHSSTASDFNVAREHRMFEDSLFALLFLMRTERAGFISEPLYKYTVYDTSYTYNKIGLWMSDYEKLYTGTRKYLKYFGMLSKLNHDFLYAIYISNMVLTAEMVFHSAVSLKQKLLWIFDIISKPLVSEIFLLKNFDPQIRLLAERNKVIDDFVKMISIPEIIDGEGNLYKALVRELEDLRSD